MGGGGGSVLIPPPDTLHPHYSPEYIWDHADCTLIFDNDLEIVKLKI